MVTLSAIGQCTFQFIDGRLEDLAGRTVPGYRIEELMGRGSGGVVYRAQNSDTEEVAAIKFIDPSLTNDPTVKARTSNAIRNWGRLEHANIVPVLDEGLLKELLYIVMPYYDNGSLGMLAEDTEHLVDPAIVTALVLDACAGLEAAAKGIGHTTINPGDILINQDGIGLLILGLPHPKLETSSESSDDIVGDSSDYATSLVELGSSLYIGLTGKKPSIPSKIQPRKLRPEISVKLNDCVSTLAADASSRFPTWTAVNQALSKALGSLSIKEAVKQPIQVIEPEPTALTPHPNQNDIYDSADDADSVAEDNNDDVEDFDDDDNNEESSIHEVQQANAFGTSPSFTPDTNG